MEFYHNFKENGWIYVVKLMIASCLFCFLYTTVGYFFESQRLNERYQSQSEDTLIRVIDNLVDGNDFYAYSTNSDNLIKVQNFYTLLNQHQEFNYLTLTTQPIAIPNFSDANNFRYDANGDGFIDEDESKFSEADIEFSLIKTLALNHNAFTYYQLAGEELLNWSELDYESEFYPIILGSNYADSYALGDVIDARYVNKEFQLEVVGFLPSATSVFYQGNIDFYLDDYLVFPYPQTPIAHMSEDLLFERIILFNLVNGDIITTHEFDEVVNLVHQVGKQSGFHEYTFIDVPSFYIQNNNLRIALSENSVLIMTLSSLFALFALLITTYLNFLLYKRRYQLYLIHYVSGESWRNLQRRFMFDGIYECLALPVIVIGFGLSQKIFNLPVIIVVFSLFIAWIATNLCIYCYQFTESNKKGTRND